MAQWSQLKLQKLVRIQTHLQFKGIAAGFTRYISTFPAYRSDVKAQQSLDESKLHTYPRIRRFHVRSRKAYAITKGDSDLQKPKKNDSIGVKGLYIEPRNRLQVVFDRGQGSLHPIFLRDQCRCNICVDPHSGQKNFETADIPANISVRGLTRKDPTDSVEISWTNDLPGYQSTHITTVSQKDLHTWSKFKANVQEVKPSFQPWNREKLAKRLAKVEYNSFMNNDVGFAAAIYKLQQDGLIIIENVPSDEVSVELVGQRIGPLRNTFYGRTWDVKDVEQAENVAYTSKHLNLHMDLLYMKVPPGLQLLHCINQSSSGGVSSFSDSFQAISELRKWAFDSLASFPISYAYQKGGHFYQDTKPVIELSPFNIEPAQRHDVTAVHWSPPFQGPLKYDIGSQDNGLGLETWLKAAKIFQGRINSDNNLYLHKLEPGQCVIFNNRRVLHGRTAFDNVGKAESHTSTENVEGPTSLASQPRWLKGAYIDTQDFNSTYRRIMDNKV